MLSKFFVDRPVFTWVMAIIMMLVGALSLKNLPVSQYPEIAPPQIVVSATYPGADAQTVSNTVTQILEQRLTGLNGFLYMSSTSDSSGAASIQITFEPGTDPQLAQVQVQNKIQGAINQLPQAVQRLGVSVEQTSADMLMVVAFVSSDPSFRETDLGDFLTSSVQEPLTRVQGVGDVTIFGTPYAMRIWLDPNRLASFKMTPADVIAQIQQQNVQVAAGSLGASPTVPGQPVTFSVTGSKLFTTPQQFENITLKSDTNGRMVKLKDVGRVEVGRQQYAIASTYNHQPTSGLGIKLAPGANALATAERVNEKLKELAPSFPEGISYVVAYDTTPFVSAALHEVKKTLFEAIVLVVLVMFLFLQNIRATLIPTIAVPVVLLGTFALMYVFGFSINVLTMFAMVLAIGLLVDDAIVVVENVERVMHEDGTDPKTATIKSMGEIEFALIGIAMVLSAVFLPMAFFGGSTGVIYRQFSVTIVSAMVLSVWVALTLTPSLCATFLRQQDVDHEKKNRGFFGWFNRGFDKLTQLMMSFTGRAIKGMLVMLAVYAGIVGVMVWGFMKLPTSFMPQEDQGVMLMMTQLPPGASANETKAELAKIGYFMDKTESANIESHFLVNGFSFAGNGPNMGFGFIKLKPWEERKAPSQHISEIQKRMMGAFLFAPMFNNAITYAFPLPPVPSLGLAEGFDLYIQNTKGDSHEKFTQYLNEFLAKANKDPLLVSVRHNGMPDQSSLHLTVNRDKVLAHNLNLSEVNANVATILSGTYVNDYEDRGRIKQVWVQGQAKSRMTQSDLMKWKIRNNDGQMVPLGEVATISWDYTSPRLERFNGLPSFNIQGSAAPGISTGTAMDRIEELVKEVFPEGYTVSWSGVSYQEKMSGNQGPALFAISLIVVFLSLAALYESWTVPIAVIIMVPAGVVGAIMLTMGVGLTNDVYFKVGLLTTIGLVCKNAILIVEFAKDYVEAGHGVIWAAKEAIRVRLRPILMTSLAFGLGVLPLTLASGPGAGAQNSIGFGVLGGMLAGTFLVLLFVPVFYVLVLYLVGVARPGQSSPDDNAPHESADAKEN